MPLNDFFVFAPLVLLSVHFAILLQHAILHRALLLLNRVLEVDERRNPTIREELHSYFFTQTHSGPRDNALLPLVQMLMAKITLIIMPTLLLLYFQIKYIPYHDPYVTWLHRIYIVCDVFILLVVGRFIWKQYPLLYNGNKTKQRLLRAHVFIPHAALAACIFVSFSGASIPHEGLDKFFFWTLGMRPNYLDYLGIRRNLTLADQDLVLDAAVSSGETTLILRDRNYRDANFYRTDLKFADFQGADLRGASFVYANAKSANFYRARLDGADLEGISLEEANLRDARFTAANLTGAKLQGANLAGAFLVGATLNGAQLQGANLERANLAWAELQGSFLDGAKCNQANLSGANFSNAQILGASLRWTRIFMTNFSGSKLQGTDFSNASIWGVEVPSNVELSNFSGSYLQQLQIRERAKFEAYMHRIRRNRQRVPLNVHQLAAIQRIEAALTVIDRSSWEESKDDICFWHRRKSTSVDQPRLASFLATIACRDNTPRATVAVNIIERFVGKERYIPGFGGALTFKTEIKSCNLYDKLPADLRSELDAASGQEHKIVPENTSGINGFDATEICDKNKNSK